MERTGKHLKYILMAVMLILLAAAAAVLLRGYFSGRFTSIESLQEYLAAFGIFAPLVLILFQTLQVVLPVLPGFVGCLAGAGMFGAFAGFWCNYIGISVGSILAFFLARRFGAELVEQIAPQEKYAAFVHWLNSKKCYTVILFLSILLPLAPDDFLCYFSGLTKMSAQKFIWIIVLGKPWCILMYSLLFVHLI